MPNIKSAKKRVLVNRTKAQRNKSRNSALKTAIKKANAAIETNAADKEQVVQVAVKKIDQAAAKGLIHKTMLRAKSPLLLVSSMPPNKYLRTLQTRQPLEAGRVFDLV